ncbi:MAG: hypothetical protein QOG33_2708 [Gaiellales bacterium]|jgi:hypothetical protein|nr:hypothetical protein [Gaiellales bacterium]
MRFLRRRLLMLPLVLLAAPLWRHFHPSQTTHSWLEGKVSDQANRELAPVKATDVHCDVQGSLADCTITTSDGHKLTVHVTRSGDTWTPERAVLVS